MQKEKQIQMRMYNKLNFDGGAVTLSRSFILKGECTSEFSPLLPTPCKCSPSNHRYSRSGFC